MYLKKISLWNWRKFSQTEAEEAGIEVEFNNGLNIIVGENDVGKTAVIDAIKGVLGTNSQDPNWISELDFYGDCKNLKIECVFCDLTELEEAFFYEWLTMNPSSTELRVVLTAEIYEDINNQTKIKKILKAGPENLENNMDETARQLLAVTYLKPLRDARAELSPGNKSRIAQVVKSLKEFDDESPHHKEVLDNFSLAFDKLKGTLDEPVLKKVESTISDFFGDNNKKKPEIRNRELTFSEILKKLELNLGEVGTGLGSSNILFMAVELLLLSEAEIGPKIALIEEIEAHIHPQAQLRLIKSFERSAIDSGMQYIFTSHSPVLASSISLESIIFMYKNKAYSMKGGETKLEKSDYEFLERFLDATKANMFFAQGLIFVEGDAENLLLPAIAEVIGRPLHRYGISIVNVGNLAFKRYSSIFLRANKDKAMNFPIAIMTDLDLKPVDYYDDPSYFEIDTSLNSQIAELFGADELKNDYENTYINLNEAMDKAKLLYGKKLEESLPKAEKKQKFKEIKNEVKELLTNSEVRFEEYKEKTRDKLNKRYYDGEEQTKVFISEPWTLEHTLALSNLYNSFEDTLLNINYTLETYKTRQKKIWEEETQREERATSVYSFLLEKQVSKAIVAQEYAKYLIENKDDIKEILCQDTKLNYIVDAIIHVTGGDESEFSRT